MLMPSIRRKQAVTRTSTTTPLGSNASGPRKRATGARTPVSRNRSKLLTCILALAARLRGPLAIEPSDVVIEARVDGCVPRINQRTTMQLTHTQLLKQSGRPSSETLSMMRAVLLVLIYYGTSSTHVEDGTYTRRTQDVHKGKPRMN
ncbi:hypothetical protein LSAT2_023556, partial [Lamellibrachia satsuma]